MRVCLPGARNRAELIGGPDLANGGDQDGNEGLIARPFALVLTGNLIGLVFAHGVLGMIFSTVSAIRSRLATVIGSGAFGRILRRSTPRKQSSLPHVRCLLDGRSRAARQMKSR
jgi:hypothetical protein